MDRQQAMNCILAGAIALRDLQDGKEDEVRDQLAKLTSTFEPGDVAYLIFWLKGIHAGQILSRTP